MLGVAFARAGHAAAKAVTMGPILATSRCVVQVANVAIHGVAAGFRLPYRIEPMER